MSEDQRSKDARVRNGGVTNSELGISRRHSVVWIARNRLEGQRREVFVGSQRKGGVSRKGVASKHVHVEVQPTKDRGRKISAEYRRTMKAEGHCDHVGLWEGCHVGKNSNVWR